jgi:chemotaxis protein MotB
MSTPRQVEGRGVPQRGRRGGNRHHALVSHERWIVSYADFMTLLFALFVVLFAASVHSKAVLGQLRGAIQNGFRGGSATLADGVATSGSPTLPANRQETRAGTGVASAITTAAGREKARIADAAAAAVLEQAAGELRGVLGDAIARHEVQVTETPEGLVLSFEELGFFRSGEANLVPGQAAKIVAAGAILQRHNLIVRVEGHSDDQPIHNAEFSSNWELSAARAMAVLLLLVDQTSYDPTRLSMAGYGSYRPVASNATAEGRERNRRVDMVVLRDQALHPAS